MPQQSLVPQPLNPNHWFIPGDSNNNNIMDSFKSFKSESAWTTQQRDGYPALADFVAQDFDDETFVFRRFKNLAARNILHLQGELMKLEQDAQILDREAAASCDHELHSSMRSWKVLDENARDPTREHERKRMELAVVLEVKLRKYCQ